MLHSYILWHFIHSWSSDRTLRKILFCSHLFWLPDVVNCNEQCRMTSMPSTFHKNGFSTWGQPRPEFFGCTLLRFFSVESNKSDHLLYLYFRRFEQCTFSSLQLQRLPRTKFQILRGSLPFFKKTLYKMALTTSFGNMIFVYLRNVSRCSLWRKGKCKFVSLCTVHLFIRRLYPC